MMPDDSTRDSLGRKRSPSQDAALERINAELRLSGDLRPTRAYRFTLPRALADRFEAMSKIERDAVLERALKTA